MNTLIFWTAVTVLALFPLYLIIRHLMREFEANQTPYGKCHASTRVEILQLILNVLPTQWWRTKIVADGILGVRTYHALCRLDTVFMYAFGILTGTLVALLLRVYLL